MTKTPRFLLGLTATVAILGTSAPSLLHGQDRSRAGGDRADDQQQAREPAMSPRSRPPQDNDPPPPPGEEDPSVEITFPEEMRTIDGVGNNVANPGWGAIDQIFLRHNLSNGASVAAGDPPPSPHRHPPGLRSGGMFCFLDLPPLRVADSPHASPAVPRLPPRDRLGQMGLRCPARPKPDPGHRSRIISE